MWYPFIRKLLFTLEAERSHHLGLRGLACLAALGWRQRIPDQPRTVMGIRFPNPIGIAAGLDKNAEYLQPLSRLGVGFIEVGTVTPKPQAGNPKPRLFRLPGHTALINRLGFNNKGVDASVKNIVSAQYQGILGVNIGKNKETPLEHAVNDYLYCMERVYPVADYITVNISSPNTPGLRELQNEEYLHDFLGKLKAKQADLEQEYDKYVPLVVKIAPDLIEEQVVAMANFLLEHRIDGVIATNTAISREAVSDDPISEEQGGLSGAPLLSQSCKIIQTLYTHLENNIPIIGVGGITNAKAARQMLDAGAQLVQVYTGLIYHGPRLIKEIAKVI